MRNIIFILLFISSVCFSQKIYTEPKTGPIWFYNCEPETYIPLYYTKIEKEETNEEIIIPPSDRDCVVNTFTSQIGIREKGNNSGKEVEMYLASAGLAKGNPWCASFVQWSMLQCTDIKITAAGWVPSWFPQKKLIFVRGKLDIKPPQAGDLIGIWFANKNRLAHIGFYESQEGDFIISVEGNTNEEGSREGDGVYRKKRIARTIHSISSWLP